MFNLELGATASKNLALSIVIILMGVVARLIAEVVIKAIVKRVEDDNPDEDSDIEKRAYTLASIIKNTANLLIIVSIMLSVMSQWGIDITPILTGAGILGLAVGFGAQSLVKDVVTGFFILLENTYNIGDKIKIAGVEGKVVKMNLRTTILLSESGEEFTIPNSHISTIQKNGTISKEHE